jgi:hypothetical protein
VQVGPMQAGEEQQKSGALEGQAAAKLAETHV